MKQVVAVLISLLATLVALPAMAEEMISLKRGLPTDIWLTWPEHDRLDDPYLIEMFPEYRREFKGTEFAMAKAAGFDFVRLTIDPAIFLTKLRPEKTAKLLKGMKTAIDDILAAGLNVDVDMHSVPRTDGAPGTDQVLASDALFADYLKVVGDIGRAIAEYPSGRVAFEPMNEPTIDCELEPPANGDYRWPAKLVELHSAARTAAPKLTIVLSGACWGSAASLDRVDPAQVKDDNVIWSFHNYEPFVFTHQGADWTDGHVRYLSALHFPPQPKQKKRIMTVSANAIAQADVKPEHRKQMLEESAYDLTEYFEPGKAVAKAKAGFVTVEKWATANEISADRILMGEFGAIRPEKITAEKQRERASYYKLIRTEAEKRGYGWSTWSWNGGFGLSKTYAGRTFDPVMMRALGLK